MLKVSELAKPTKEDIQIIDKVSHIIMYLYSGERLNYQGYNYAMDGDFNLYIVATCSDTVSKVTYEIPMFQNDNFHSVMVNMASTLEDRKYDEIKLHNATVRVLNKGDIRCKYLKLSNI